MLSFFPDAVNQGRLTWRHNSVLNKSTATITKSLSPSQKVDADLPNHLANSSSPSTMPVNISATSDRPDLVMMNEVDKRIAIVELTICRSMPSAFADARMHACLRKEAKYAPRVNDLEQKNYQVSYRTIEIRTQDYFTSSARKPSSPLILIDINLKLLSSFYQCQELQ